MSKSKFGNILIALLIAAMFAATACAQAAPETTPATPAKPVEKPAAQATTTAPATTPAATPVPATPKEVSFQATTYTDDKNGFTIQHPKSWKQQGNLTGYYVYNAKVDPMPNFYISIFPSTNFDEISKISDKAFKDLGGTDLKYGDIEKMTIAGKEGTYSVLEWVWPGGYDLETHMATVVKDGKTYAMSLTVAAGGISPNLVKEIFSTFQFK